MEKVLVQWSDGKSKGTTSLVKKNAVKNGTIAVGEKVMVAWGKAKKTYKAQVVDVNVGVRSPPTPQKSTSTDEDTLVFDLVAPATQTMRDNRQDDTRLGALQEKLEDLADAVSGIEARLLCHLQTLDEKVTALQKDIQERGVPQPIAMYVRM